jgi:APA family basic amino acid/polyamine antiporter
MGLHRQLPDRVRELHPRFRTPWIGILVFGAIACLTLIPGQATFLGNMYAFGAMLSFTIAHLSVIRLRLTDPGRERPYRGPGTIRIAGRPLPLFAVLGGLGTFLAFVTVTALHIGVAIAGIGWLSAGITIFIFYRRRQHLDLTTTFKATVPASVTDHEVEYDSVLVAFDERAYESTVMATAASLATHRRRGIHVLVTITVPTTSPIDASLPDQEAAAQAVINAAKAQVGRRVSGHWEKVRPGQSGRRIVDEALAIQAGAIVMSLPERSGGAVFDKTIATLLRERPCRIIIESASQ